MSGFQEILVIVLIVLAIFFVPRMRQAPQRRKPQAKPRSARPFFRGRTRLAIFLSLLWLGLVAAHFQPWRSGLLSFLYFGAGPVALGWGIAWVLKGFGKAGRHL
ncbi:MAG: hypothetical protein P8X55_00950 [Desulfosarcinaceae bacterium]